MSKLQRDIVVESEAIVVHRVNDWGNKAVETWHGSFSIYIMMLHAIEVESGGANTNEF